MWNKISGEQTKQSRFAAARSAFDENDPRRKRVREMLDHPRLLFDIPEGNIGTLERRNHRQSAIFCLRKLPAHAGAKRTVSPLTPALSPLRGEGEATVAFGYSVALARRNSRPNRPNTGVAPSPYTRNA